MHCRPSFPAPSPLVRFGFTDFPAGTDPNSCSGSSSSLLVPCGFNTAQTISDTVQTVEPAGGTPTGESLNGIRQSAALTESDRPRYVILVTDGEPTAHIEERQLCLIYPPSEKSARATLNEARRCAAAGIRVSSFALIEDYFYVGLVNFVEEMARVSQGVAAFCSVDDLGKFVFQSFVGGRQTKRYNQ